MLFWIIGVFVMAAGGGMYLLSYVLQDKNTPKSIAMIHGAVAALGIILLGFYTYYHHSLITCLVIFCLVAVGGIYLITRDILGNKVPKYIAVGHGFVALIGIACLVFYAVYQAA